FFQKFQSTCPSRATAMVKMTPDIIKIIVDTHNDYRNKFAGGLHSYPRAARMATLRWDPELAKVADALVRQCRTYDDDDCVKTPKYEYADASYHMQKYYCMSTKKNVLRKQLADWIDPTNQENVVMLYLNSDKKDIEYSQHFFQVLRDRANRLGCAIIEFIRPSLVHQLLKCVYNCGVTIATDEFNPVYEVTGGNAASNCTKGANKVYQYLCHKNEPVKNCDGGDLFAPTDEEKMRNPIQLSSHSRNMSRIQSCHQYQTTNTTIMTKGKIKCTKISMHFKEVLVNITENCKQFLNG
ncbi:antigen 5 like allergen Cul n 1-like, partial [Drosophila ficusphila]|uniref:antigen 5 like allergen Cul n 1-like n=1 Tax=Drosophila ficusphila TaxID=30025 RepID=UPI001C890336